MPTYPLAKSASLLADSARSSPCALVPVQMPEHALEEMSGSVAPLGIEATRSKSVVLPSSIADAGVRAVHGEQH